MAMVICPECGKSKSDKADNCIHCGAPVERSVKCLECGMDISMRAQCCECCGAPVAQMFHTAASAPPPRAVPPQYQQPYQQQAYSPPQPQIIYQQAPLPQPNIIVNNSSSSCANAMPGYGVRRKRSLLLDLVLICLTGGMWILWMIIRPKYY